MFGIGTWELVVIAALALIILGPKKLPEVARTVGKTLSQLRRSVDDVKREIDVDGLRQDIQKEMGVEELSSFVHHDLRDAARTVLQPDQEQRPAKAGEAAPSPRPAGTGKEESDTETKG